MMDDLSPVVPRFPEKYLQTLQPPTVLEVLGAKLLSA